MVRDPNGERDKVARLEAKRVGRPSKAESFRELVSEWLGRDAQVSTHEILRRARLAGYQGQKSAFYALVQSLRSASRTSVLESEFLPGEFTRHAFGRADVRFLEGSRCRVHFLATRLEYSRWVEVSLVADQQFATHCRALVEHFVRLGGVPLVAIFERPGSLAVARTGGHPRFRPEFAPVALELGIGVEVPAPCRSYERRSFAGTLISLRRFLKSAAFADRSDLERQLSAWILTINSELSRQTGKAPLHVKREEEPRLRPLRVSASDLGRQ
jgi:hypothetical protein